MLTSLHIAVLVVMQSIKTTDVAACVGDRLLEVARPRVAAEVAVRLLVSSRIEKQEVAEKNDSFLQSLAATWWGAGPTPARRRVPLTPYFSPSQVRSSNREHGPPDEKHGDAQ